MPQDTGLVFADKGGEAVCGNGSLDPGEDCESPFADCCDSETCFFKSSETSCRPAAGECDVGEVCSGSSDTCPVDEFAANGTKCSGGVCYDNVCAIAQEWLIGNVLYFSFNNGTATDHSGMGNHGTLSGGVASVPGKHSLGLSFDGVDDHIEIPDSSSLFLGNTLTIEAWLFRTTEVEGQTIYSDLDTLATPDTEFSLEVRPAAQGGLDLISNSGCTNESESVVLGDGMPVAMNVWTHIAVTWDGSTVRYYLDGTFKDQQPFAHAPCKKPKATFHVGQRPSGSYPFAGVMDELKLSSYAKSDVEIQQSMGYDSTPTCGNGTLEPGEDCESPFDLCCESTSCAYHSPKTQCRATTDPCDPAELCSGASDSCPADEHLPDGTTCPNDGICQSGVCQSGTAVDAGQS